MAFEKASDSPSVPNRTDMQLTQDTIFLDNNATTKLDQRVLDSMLPHFTVDYGNPSSSHSFGLKASRAVESARELIASVIKVKAREVVFTSGSTESINLGIKGIALSLLSTGNHIITAATEHSAVLNTCKYLESIGFEVTFLPVKPNGTVDPEEFKREIRKGTILAAIMYANNETGVINPIHEIATIANARNIILFSDLTQAIGKVSIDPIYLGIDAFCISGHKFHGPKGIGAFIYNSKKIRQIESLIHGGDQEFGLRAGTLNVPAIVGLAKACEIASIEVESVSPKMEKQRNQLESKLLSIPRAFVNGIGANRIPNTSSICIPGLDVDSLVNRLSKVAISNGSACTSSLLQPSHVLLGMGLHPSDALSSMRISLSKYTTDDEVNDASELILEVIQNHFNVIQNYA